MDVIKGSHSGRSADFRGSLPPNPFRALCPYKDKSSLLAALRPANGEFATPLRGDAVRPWGTSEGVEEGCYADDVSPSYAYEVLKAESGAELIDVRTKHEWAFVGSPDLSGIGKAVSFIQWLRYPAMSPTFLSELERLMDKIKEAAIFSFAARDSARGRRQWPRRNKDSPAPAKSKGDLDAPWMLSGTGGWRAFLGDRRSGANAGAVMVKALGITI